MTSKISTELDFDRIKDSIKEYMKGQTKFSDYDFEGSALSVIIDVLAYNTHYNSLYTNMAINESFLDSASKRSSVISKAKELGYTPRSARCARAEVSMRLDGASQTPLSLMNIQRGTPFISNIDGVQYNFYAEENYSAPLQNNTTFFFDKITLVEGFPLTSRFTYQTGTPSFVIPNAGVDTTTIRVSVRFDPSVLDVIDFTPSDEIVGIDGNSNVYFLSETSNGAHRITFGDGVIGRKLEPGCVITVDYMIGNQEKANNASSFSFGGSIPSGFKPSVTTIKRAYGGAAPESIESIKWNAPRRYASQNRCVTVNDFKDAVQSIIPLDAISVWGGEDNTPPSYGDVFLCVKPSGGEFLSEAQKDMINDFINERKMLSTGVRFVDPEYIKIQLNTTYYFDPSKTDSTNLDGAVKSSIIQFSNNNLNKFDSIFRFSKFQSFIDGSDRAIMSSITTFKLIRQVKVVYNTASEYTIDLGNPIFRDKTFGSVLSNQFRVLSNQRSVFISDLPSANSTIGKLQLCYTDGANRVIVDDDIGSVDYSRGILHIRDLTILSIGRSGLSFTIIPESNDVVSNKNQIVSIDIDNMVVKGVIGTGIHQFTSSRVR